MKGKYLKKRSWERQSFYKLDNGYIVVIEYNQHYGDMVSSVRSGKNSNKVLWHCSNGSKNKPNWLLSWEKPISKGHWQTLTRPCFDKVFD